MKFNTSVEIENYLEWLDNQHLSTRTRHTYATIMADFALFADQQTMRDGADLSNLNLLANQYLTSNNAKFASTESVRAVSRSALIGFTKYCDYIAQRQMHPDSRSTNSKLILTPRDWALLQIAIDRQTSAKLRAIIRLILHSGLRVADCVRMNLEDIEIHYGDGSLVTVNVHRKLKNDGMQSSRISLHPDAAAALQRWLQVRQSAHAAQDERAVFINRYGQRISAHGVNFIIRHFGWELNIELTAGLLRRSGRTYSSEKQSAPRRERFAARIPLPAQSLESTTRYL